MKSSTWVLVICSIVLIKLLTILFFPISFNPDELSNWAIAERIIDGNGYVDNNGKLVSFHPNGPVFLYTLAIQNGINQSHFIILFNVLNLIVLAGACVSTKQILSQLNCSLISQIIGVLCIGLYPSWLWYVGSIYHYDVLIALLMPILINYFLKLWNRKQVKFEALFLLTCLIAFIAFQRTHLVFLCIAFSFGMLILMVLKNTFNRKLIIFLTLIIGFISIIYIPVLQRNKRDFGHVQLSNQFGFELLQGHNPYAKGSWNGNWNNSSNEFNIWFNKEIPNLASLNQYNEAQERKELALQWIQNNPIEELKLIVKKLAIWWYPRNYESQGIHIVNFLVHFFGLLGIIQIVRKKGIFNIHTILFLVPILVSIALSLVFFTGYRWRMYAEPSLILLAIYFFQLNKFNIKAAWNFR